MNLRYDCPFCGQQMEVNSCVETTLDQHLYAICRNCETEITIRLHWSNYRKNYMMHPGEALRAIADKLKEPTKPKQKKIYKCFDHLKKYAVYHD